MRSEPARPDAISALLPCVEGQTALRHGVVGPLAYSPGMTTGRAEPETATPELGLSPEEPLLEGRPPAGPSLSPSRAADFMTCPLLYRFRVIDRIPEAPSAAATRGTVVHSVLERLFDLPAADRTLARAQELLGPQWEALLEAEPELAVLVEARRRCAARVPGRRGRSARAATSRSRTRPGWSRRERELHVEVELESGLLLRGFVDRLDVSPAGDMRVVDYKTGRAPSPGFEAKAMFQMRFYALVLWQAVPAGPATAAAAVPRQRRGPAVRAGRGRPAGHRGQGPGAVARDRARDARPVTGVRARPGCATGATTATPVARPGAAHRRHCRPCRSRRPPRRPPGRTRAPTRGIPDAVPARTVLGSCPWTWVRQQRRGPTSSRRSTGRPTPASSRWTPSPCPSSPAGSPRSWVRPGPASRR